MSWETSIAIAEKVVDLLIRVDAHAFVLVLIGALMCLHGNKEEGQLVMGAGLAVFKTGPR